jgi:hypothetical protein
MSLQWIFKLLPRSLEEIKTLVAEETDSGLVSGSCPLFPFVHVLARLQPVSVGYYIVCAILLVLSEQHFGTSVLSYRLCFCKGVGRS